MLLRVDSSWEYIKLAPALLYLMNDKRTFIKEGRLTEDVTNLINKNISVIKGRILSSKYFNKEVIDKFLNSSGHRTIYIGPATVTNLNTCLVMKKATYSLLQKAIEFF